MSAPTGTIHVLAEAIRSRRLSVTSLVSRSIEGLERFHRLNVVAATFFDDAMRDATRLDEEGPPDGPLAGIPMLVKDLEDLEGYPTRKGSLALRDAPPATTSGVVAGRLQRAGAVAVGKSTLPEFAIEGFTSSLLTGVTRNPWNEMYSPGGSSGGVRRGSGRRTGGHRDWDRWWGFGSNPRVTLRTGGDQTHEWRHRTMARPRLDRLFDRRAFRHVVRRLGIVAQRDAGAGQR